MRKILNKLIVLFFFFSICFSTKAQIGGQSTYSFLNLPNAARVAALGGNNISIKDNDLNLAYHNPAVLNSKMHNSVVFNYISYFDDISFGYASYCRDFGKYGTFALGMYHVDYGDFTRADAAGYKHGNFTAADYVLNIIWAYQIDSSFSVGANLKPIYSHLETYKSWGVAADFGVHYQNSDKRFSASLVAKNLGTQIKPYTDNNYEPLPFEIQLGISQRLEHAPFRFSLTLQNLENWNLFYEIEEKKSFLDEEKKSKATWEKVSDEFLRHILVGVELLLTENFHVRVGYNHKRRKEMELSKTGGFTGFSWGFGFKISKFQISYGRATYHAAGASNHFSISTNLSSFRRKVVK